MPEPARARPIFVLLKAERFLHLDAALLVLEWLWVGSPFCAI
jgi:hypothetical protein